MLDEIREQRLLVCHLCIEGVLIAGARALHSAGMAGRGNRQLRPRPGVFLPEQGKLFRFLEHGGMVRGFGCRRGEIAVAWGGTSTSAIIAVAYWFDGLVAAMSVVVDTFASSVVAMLVAADVTDGYILGWRVF